MSLYLVSILKIVLICLTAGYLITRYTLARYGSSSQKNTHKKILRVGGAILALFAIFTWTNAGHFFYKVWVSNNNPLTYVTHTHEQFHFYFGSKYLPELGYDNLYKATYIASKELGLEMSQVRGMRDPLTFAWTTPDQINTSEVKARFTPERWGEFTRDVQSYFAFNPRVHAKLFADHGNTGSPAWAVVPHLVTQTTEANLPTFFWLSLLDLGLLIFAFVMLGRTFGGSVLALSLVSFAVLPYVFDFTFGSLLRFDWFAAVLIAICLFHKKRYIGAGLLFAYAITSKIFPVVFLLGLGVLALKHLVTTKRVPPHLIRFFAGVSAGIVLFGGLSAAYFYRTPDLWPQYVERIQTAASKDNIDYSYSFKAPFSQLASPGALEYIGNWFVPTLPLSQQNIDFNDPPFAGSYALALGFVSLLLIGVILKNEDEIDSIALSSLLLFFFLSLYMYYMILFVVFALFWIRKPQGLRATWYGVLFFVPWAVYHYLMHRNNEPLALATTSFWLSAYGIGILLSEAYRLGLWADVRPWIFPKRVRAKE